MRVRGSVRTVTPASGDELPILDEAPLRAVEFEPRALRPQGRPGRIAAGAWAVTVACLVGVGALATEPDQEVPLTAEATPPATTRPDSNLPSTRMGALLRLEVIDILSPAPARVEVTTRRLDVAGAVLVRAARVRIALEARGSRVLDHVSVDTSDLHGGIRPEYGPTFSATFDLPLPRPSGTMWVVVTAYDEGGMPLGAIRRPFTVGPLLEPEISLADSNPMSERWRPTARTPGPVFAPPPPTCLPVSAILASSC